MSERVTSCEAGHPVQSCQGCDARNCSMLPGFTPDAEDEEYEFLQCPHGAIKASCVGVCNCSCDGCRPTREASA